MKNIDDVASNLKMIFEFFAVYVLMIGCDEEKDRCSGSLLHIGL